MIMYLLRFVISSVCMIYASITDIQKREVSDVVWLIGIPICILIDLLDLYLDNISLMSLLSSLGVSLLLAVTLCYVGFYGGADGKALVLIAAAIPSYPPIVDFFYIKIFLFPILSVFFFSTLLSASSSFIVLILNVRDHFRGRRLLENIEKGNRLRDLLLFAMTRRVKLENLKGNLKFFPAETVEIEEGRPTRKLSYFVHAEADIDELIDNLEEYQELFKDGILAWPTIPMILFLTAGFIIINLCIIFI